MDVKTINYEEVKQLRQSEKSVVLLVRETDGEQLFIKKILKGQHNIYSELLNSPHPYLPALYEVKISDSDTTIIEEYIEGQSLGNVELSEKQLRGTIKELCSALEFLHGKGIIHRDVKPSNIILAKDGHIRLIDFDVARMVKDNLEQDTRLLGTRGYAPPEQYGFAQTDARTDIYSLGITFGQLLGERAKKFRYRIFIKKCTDLNPDKRYQSVKQAKKALAFSYNATWQFAALLTVIGILFLLIYNPFMMADDEALFSQSQEQTQGEAISGDQNLLNIEEDDLLNQSQWPTQTEATLEELPVPTADENEVEDSQTPAEDEVEDSQMPAEDESEIELATPAPVQTQPEIIPEDPHVPNSDEEELDLPPDGEYRITLTDIIQTPFNTLDSVPLQQIDAEWAADDPSSNTDATFYKDDKIIAKVILFEDGTNEIQSRKIQLLGCPDYAAEYIKLSDYLELDMSKDEVLVALEEARQYPILPYPGMVLGKNDAERLTLFYDNYTIDYFFKPEMTIVEIEVYIPRNYR